MLTPRPSEKSTKALCARRKGRGGLVFVLVNMAMTADGKIATANRAVSSFGGARDKQHLLELRATADAVMAGARTVDLNEVNLGPGAKRFREERVKRGLAEYNLRVIVSRSASVSPSATIFKKTFSEIVILTTSRANKERIEALSRVATIRCCGDSEIDFPEALRWLRKERGVMRLLCEGGGQLNDALFRSGLVDELHLTVCPYIFGGRAAPTIADGEGFASLARAQGMELARQRRLGDELYLVYRSTAAKAAAQAASPLTSDQARV